MKRPKALSLFLTTVILLSLWTPFRVQGKEEIKLWINGSYVQSDVQPQVEKNRTLVPIRVISENLGFKVLWNQEDQSIRIQKPGETEENHGFLFQIGKAEYYTYDGQGPISMDVAPKAVNNRTLVPLRIIAELFDLKVDWDQENQTAIVGQGYKPPKKVFPVNRRLQAVEKETIKLSGIHPDKAFSTNEMVGYGNCEIEVLNNILMDLLEYLSNTKQVENPVKYYAKFDADRKNKADTYLSENELGGSMAQLEYNGFVSRYTYKEIKKLSKAYLGVDTYSIGYDD